MSIRKTIGVGLFALGALNLNAEFQEERDLYGRYISAQDEVTSATREAAKNYVLERDSTSAGQEVSYLVALFGGAALALYSRKPRERESL